MERIKVLAVLNVISFLLHVTIAYMTQFKLINEKDIGEISDQYASLVTPAGFTFAIWGIIYTCLVIFCVYHIVMAYKRNKKTEANKDLRRIGPAFILINLASVAWIIAWVSGQLLLSVFLIVAQLAALSYIHIRLHIHNPVRNPASKIATELPLSIYLGWISMATIANTSAYLLGTGWDGWGIPDRQWAIIMVCATTILGLFMLFIRRNLAVALVLAWSFYGIISNLSALDGALYKNIIYTVWAGILLLVAGMIIHIVRSIHHKKHSLPLQEKTPVITE